MTHWHTRATRAMRADASTLRTRTRVTPQGQHWTQVVREVLLHAWMDGRTLTVAVVDLVRFSKDVQQPVAV
jgi:hypothetical protein